ncbi:hypothetical protein P692DRAFT_201806195 [Suillus brevipes Sb2]|nr:hypothetical protein P692DRAFT_201806195 [Suillus brevipes Sb2]
MGGKSSSADLSIRELGTSPASSYLTNSHDWWKDRFDTLGLALPSLNVNKVMDMTIDHFEQLPLGAMLLPGPIVTNEEEESELWGKHRGIMEQVLGTARGATAGHGMDRKWVTERDARRALSCMYTKGDKQVIT